MLTLNQFGDVNSTTYADVAALGSGLDRLPGESSAAFLERVARANVEVHSHVYEGVVNAIAAQLGLRVQPGIRITGPADTTLVCDLSGLTLRSGQALLTCPLVTLDEDEVWQWVSLAGIVSTINDSAIWTAVLLVDDAAAATLCRQTNAG